MLYAEMKKMPYFDFRIGVVFYFYENASEYKKEIKQIFNQYCTITKASFLYYRHNEDIGLKSLKSDQNRFFNGVIDRSAFDLTEHIILTDATKEQLQSVQCEMMLCNHEPAYPVRLPNEMYFEFLPSIPYGEILAFIRFAWSEIKMHYCCCNPLFGVNYHNINRSCSYAVKQVQKLTCLTDKYSVYDNLLFQKSLETKIDGPNAILVFSEEMVKLIGRERLIRECNRYNLYCEAKEDCIMVAVSKEKVPEDDEEFVESYIALRQMLKEIMGDIHKPEMFWKPDEWNLWQRRFDR